jgi:hypothetical protein
MIAPSAQGCGQTTGRDVDDAKFGASMEVIEKHGIEYRAVHDDEWHRFNTILREDGVDRTQQLMPADGVA